MSRSGVPLKLIAAGLAAALGLAACGSGPSPVPTAPPTSSFGATPAALEPVTVGLGFIPSVQFAPFYLALQRGYYADAGLAVTFRNQIDPDLIALVGQGSVDLGIADGTSVIPAVSQGIPIRYVGTVYGKFPSIVFAKASSGIAGPADLAGRKLGIPGRFGSSWIMLQALLGSVGLTPDDLEIIDYPDFGQGAAVTQGAVDAATGFANNEPVQLSLTGAEVVVLRVDEITPLPGPGLIAGTALIADRPEVVRAVVAATLRAMAEIAADPQVGLDAAITAVPELAGDEATQRAILDATIDAWRGPGGDAGAFGAIDRDGWAASVAFMTELGLVANPVAVGDLVDGSFVAGRP